MIEKIVLDYLEDQLDYPVGMEVPEDTDQEFIVIEKTGSGKTDHISNSTIAIQSYAESLYRAASINEEVKAAMDNICSLPEIVRSTINSDYNYSDTSSRRYRYQAVYDLIHY